MQGSIFGVSFDFSYNENGLHIIHIHSHSYSDMASVSIGTLWRAVRRELWTELLVCHRQTHNLWKWLHRAGSFWKWHFRSVRGEILCVCVGFNLRGLFNLMPQSDVPSWPWRRHIWKYCVFGDVCLFLQHRVNTAGEKVFDCVHSINWSCEQGFSLLKRGSTRSSPAEPEKHHQLPPTNYWLVCGYKQTRIDGTTARNVTNCSCLIPSNNF